MKKLAMFLLFCLSLCAAVTVHAAVQSNIPAGNLGNPFMQGASDYRMTINKVAEDVFTITLSFTLATDNIAPPSGGSYVPDPFNLLLFGIPIPINVPSPSIDNATYGYYTPYSFSVYVYKPCANMKVADGCFAVVNGKTFTWTALTSKRLQVLVSSFTKAEILSSTAPLFVKVGLKNVGGIFYLAQWCTPMIAVSSATNIKDFQPTFYFNPNLHLDGSLFFGTTLVATPVFSSDLLEWKVSAVTSTDTAVTVSVIGRTSKLITPTTDVSASASVNAAAFVPVVNSAAGINLSVLSTAPAEGNFVAMVTIPKPATAPPYDIQIKFGYKGLESPVISVCDKAGTLESVTFCTAPEVVETPPAETPPVETPPTTITPPLVENTEVAPGGFETGSTSKLNASGYDWGGGCTMVPHATAASGAWLIIMLVSLCAVPVLAVRRMRK